MSHPCRLLVERDIVRATPPIDPQHARTHARTHTTIEWLQRTACAPRQLLSPRAYLRRLAEQPATQIASTTTFVYTHSARAQRITYIALLPPLQGPMHSASVSQPGFVLQ